MSRRVPLTGEIIPTGEWVGRPALFNRTLQVLKDVLRGVGDTAFERVFRMNATLCIHRAMTLDEMVSLPAWWREAPAVGIAGPAVEVLSSRGASGRPAQQPCENPRRTVPPIPGYDPRLWIPEGCGVCEPCVDRARVRERDAR